MSDASDSSLETTVPKGDAHPQPFLPLLFLQERKHIINDIVNNMYSPAVNIHDDIITIAPVLMDHSKSPF